MTYCLNSQLTRQNLALVSAIGEGYLLVGPSAPRELVSFYVLTRVKTLVPALG